MQFRSPAVAPGAEMLQDDDEIDVAIFSGGDARQQAICYANRE
jgi:hypothetical protein